MAFFFASCAVDAVAVPENFLDEAWAPHFS
jgi:hypothetical protein